MKNRSHLDESILEHSLQARDCWRWWLRSTALVGLCSIVHHNVPR